MQSRLKFEQKMSLSFNPREKKVVKGELLKKSNHCAAINRFHMDEHEFWLLPLEPSQSRLTMDAVFQKSTEKKG